MDFSKFFEEIPDPRVDRTKRHKLTDILMIVLITTISGCKGWDEMYQMAASGEDMLRTLLELPNGIPGSDTLRRVISALDPIAFRNAFIAWAQALCISTEGKLVAIDGKTVRGTTTGPGGQALHLVSAWVRENGMVLGQYATDAKSNEITAIPALIALLELRGAVVTIDAMGCQKKIAECIRAKNADYLFGLKGNQPTLHTEVLQAFDESTCATLREEPTSFHESVDKAHGRLEVRRTWVLRNIEWLTQSDDWKDLQSLILVESQRTLHGATSSERRAYISSLEGSAERFDDLVRGHWSIENNLHWVLDVTFGEDHARIAKKNGTENMALIRKMALGLLKNVPGEKPNVSIRTRTLKAAWHFHYLLKVLSGGFPGN